MANGSPRSNGQRDFQSVAPANGPQWDTPFARFVGQFGVRSLADRLSIEPSAVYHWIRGATQPRAAIAFDICELAREVGTALSFEEVYKHSRKPRDCKTEKDPALAQGSTPPKHSAPRIQSKPTETTTGHSRVSSSHRSHSLILSTTAPTVKTARTRHS